MVIEGGRGATFNGRSSREREFRNVVSMCASVQYLAAHDLVEPVRTNIRPLGRAYSFAVAGTSSFLLPPTKGFPSCCSDLCLGLLPRAPPQSSREAGFCISARAGEILLPEGDV